MVTLFGLRQNRSMTAFGLNPVCIAPLALCLAASCAAAPVYHWNFGAEETSKLEAHGNVQRDVPGPRPPNHPGFESNNTAVRLDGEGAHLSFADPGLGSPLDAGNGDAVTLEAWVNLESLPAGKAAYIIGKGRTGASGAVSDNQNWALRVMERGGKAHLNFLFATPRKPDQAARDSHWHRWTALEGFEPKSGWHHLAVSYRFGEPETIRGWLDGRPQKGGWDMGGPTREAPVVDDDPVWLGSAQKGARSSSLEGSLDAVAIHRELAADEWFKGIATAAASVPPPKPAPAFMPLLGTLPPDKVQVTLHEGMPDHTRWLNEQEAWPQETLRWNTSAFLTPRLPLRYDAWGIRDVWKGPVLMRLAADVELPAGTLQLLLRARGVSRVWVDGELVSQIRIEPSAPPKKEGASEGKEVPSETPLPPSPGIAFLSQKSLRDGEELVTPLGAAPLPGARATPFGQTEVMGEIRFEKAAKRRVVVETLVGSSKSRAETGELCLAFKTAEGTRYAVMGAGGSPEAMAMTDEVVEPALDALHTALDALDTRNRTTAAASRDAFWNLRHATAQDRSQTLFPRAWPASTGEPHPIDAFISQKIANALEAAGKTPLEEARLFHTQVLSLLKDECFRCHGEKEKGGLKLDSREAALRPGESGKPALVPGNPSASELLSRVRSRDPEERMPPKGEGLKPAQIQILEDWVKSGAAWPAPPVSKESVAQPPLVDDAAFFRRLSLDLLGVPLAEGEVRSFLEDRNPDKRERLIERFLQDPRWADAWMPYWLDVLAENPALINPSLNTTGPFRWFLWEALRDNKPMDRLVTELVLLRGSPHTGGSAGFGVAGENDAPFATKAQILGTAFLGIELQCARCHDSPYHSTKQADLYAMAALFERKSVTVPKRNTVPAAFFEKKARESLIKVTLRPGEPVKPVWPFGKETGSVDGPEIDSLVQDVSDLRERFAALLTAPQNKRFAQVIVNRVWRRFIGAGFVEPVQDWEGHAPSHPELLDWLAGDFISHGYDLKHLTRRILTSKLYQREATGTNLAASSQMRFFNAPERRRLSAEQVVDSMHAAAGRPFETERITFDPAGRRKEGARIDLGLPQRAWMLASLTNERDRPSLSLPHAQRVVDVLEAFGWTGARQSARTDRETSPNVLQPGVLANSTLSTILTRASHGSALAQLAVDARSPEDLLGSLYLRYLGRLPTPEESAALVPALANGFGSRLLQSAEIRAPEMPPPLPKVTWFNHASQEANEIALLNDKRARKGPPADPRLHAEWRAAYEDVVWTILNSREFVWLP
jgi:hypothetical protein